MIKIAKIKEVLTVSITNHFGKNPKKGGRPPKDRSSINISVLWLGVLDEMFSEDRLDKVEEVHNKSINGVVIII